MQPYQILFNAVAVVIFWTIALALSFVAASLVTPALSQIFGLQDSAAYGAVGLAVMICFFLAFRRKWRR